MSIVFVTTSGADYFRPWIYPTLGMVSCRVVCLLDPTDDRPLPVNAERVEFESDRFYQDGKFLSHIPNLQDDDVVMLADADAVLQRDLTPFERYALENLGEAVLVGYNVGKGQRGCEEISMMKLRSPIDVVARAFKVSEDDLRECRMYNWGLVAAKVSTWRRLSACYRGMTEGTNPQDHFRHPTWMQYLLCVCLHKWKMKVVEMPYSMHTHYHFGIPTDSHGVKHRIMFFDYRRVFYAHMVQGVCYGN